MVTLNVGEPLSVTLTLTVFVLGPCASLGVHVITPLLAPIVIPLGALTSAKVNVFAGISESLAVFVTVKVVNSLIA